MRSARLLRQALLLARGSPADGGVSAYVAVETQLGDRDLGTTQRDALLQSLGR